MPSDKLLRDDWLTLEQVERIVANHESGVQLCQVELYRQLADAMRENERLRERAKAYDQSLAVMKSIDRVLCGEVTREQALADLQEELENANEHPVASKGICRCECNSTITAIHYTAPGQKAVCTQCGGDIVVSNKHPEEKP